jgi:ketosteroid isomerase-like protein
MENLEIVQKIYEAFGAGHIPTILDLLADDVEFGSMPESTVAPWYGRRTKAEVPAFFQTLADTVEVTRFEPLAFAATDDTVMAVIRFGFTVNANGKTGEYDIHHWWQLRDGKVVLYRGMDDTELVGRALAA